MLLKKIAMILKLPTFIFISLFAITVANAQSFFKKEKTLKKNEIPLITNAVFDEIKIDSAGTDFAEYFIFDRNKKLIRQGWFMGAVPVQYLAPGNYFLTVRTKDEIFKRQFLKLKSGNSMSLLSQKRD
jgi:hypothetical protein